MTGATKLFVSFSGGRTSGYMTERIRREWRDRYSEIVVVFANSGKEDRRTLDFVNRCDEVFGFETVWVEAVVHSEKGRGTTHRVVNYETASRDGAPFATMCAKFGVPNSSFPHCTRELKQRPMYSYLRDLGWARADFDVAVGIRADEADRMSARAAAENIVYPLVRWGVKKADVLNWWREQPFDLYLPEHYGNCDFCWKKSNRKLKTLALENPKVFDFPGEMEKKYGWAGPGERTEPRVFFRGKRSAQDILAESRQPFEPFTDANATFDPAEDVGGGCGDSCEVFADEFDSAYEVFG